MKHRVQDNHGLYFGFRMCLDDVDKPVKNKIQFNHKLYFIINSHNYVIFTTKYNHRLNSLAVFWYVQKICLGVKNICLPFVTCIKQTRNSTISCILFKIRIMMLCSHNNTTCGWIWLLFSAAYEDMLGRKNICPHFVTRIKQT